ncbi:MAG: hypothetical protein WCP69_04850 [Bacteroidota bacterium]
METTDELLRYIKTHVPNFSNPKIISSGVAYHYTMHSDLIQKDGRIKGRIIDENIDCSQNDFVSIPATENNGVVFAYESLVESKLEAFVLPEDKQRIKIIKNDYNSAVYANHQQEVDYTGAPPTIIILAHEITNFQIIYP